jgi:hypothetical protein
MDDSIVDLVLRNYDDFLVRIAKGNQIVYNFTKNRILYISMSKEDLKKIDLYGPQHGKDIELFNFPCTTAWFRGVTQIEPLPIYAMCPEDSEGVPLNESKKDSIFHLIEPREYDFAHYALNKSGTLYVSMSPENIALSQQTTKYFQLGEDTVEVLLTTPLIPTFSNVHSIKPIPERICDEYIIKVTEREEE